MRRSLYLIVAILTFGLGTALVILFSAKYYMHKPAAPAETQSVEAVPPLVTEESDEYAVFSAALIERYGARTDRLIVIRNYAGGCNSIGYDPTLPEDGRGMPDVPADLYREFRTKNKQCMNLEGRFDLSVPHANSDFSISYTFISDEELRELEGHKSSGAITFWPDFYRKYKNSDGLIAFSRVAFDPTLEHALLFVSHSCDSTCGEGYFVLLGKEQGKWRVKKRVGVWIS